jgi:hypothetical protein
MQVQRVAMPGLEPWTVLVITREVDSTARRSERL